MTTVLLTGFEAFAGDAANPSGDAVRTLAAEWDGPANLVTEVLPVTFAGAAARLRALIAEHSPDVVLAAGLAGGTAAIRVERVAVNLVDARIPDNDGAQPLDEPSVAGAATGRFATLPTKAIAAAIRAAGIPADVSYSAGTFVCNHVFFTALDAAAPTTHAGFIHVPWATGQAPAGIPSLDLRDITRALRIAIETALTGADDGLVGGALH
ncbi:MAG: pyroglutamyl-peptidase I [Microbacterium sp. SCN 70-200]|uniref:pyroglutamyl-peptidase I n=1 Tax=unclassified Microbacterium TaxID=2609290 RepID=UPI00086BB8E0|nr:MULTISPECIES: pyroglutamyl-peptidase I [unclassified Microbacterium]MBN9213990.1 pyroglutamyl-peptidase I [Microbacterium sp.]ODT39459.1 MAG: pyroglutamyl-peptidase I [Microbacterium sp. SCN 70-200]OJV82887.1 MAG: pyroglutamyl-peptidase I [Microbacterium sp. 70-16]